MQTRQPLVERLLAVEAFSVAEWGALNGGHPWETRNLAKHFSDPFGHTP